MIKFSLSSEEINSNGGFSIVRRLLDLNPGMALWDSKLAARHNALYSTSSIVRSMIGLMTAGESDYSSICKFRNDLLLRQLAGGELPDQTTFRQRLNALAGADWEGVLDLCVANQLRRARLTRLRFDGMELVPLDIDVSVLEDKASRKEGVSRTYHNVDGYAPIFCHAGREGYMVANELRPGSQHSEKGAVDFLKRCVAIMQMAGFKAHELLVRVDSGHDSSDFIETLDELGVRYLVKRNLRSESREQLLDTIRFYESPEVVRPGKTIFRGVRSDRRPCGYPGYKGFMAVQATERTSLANGQRLLMPSVEVDSWWTNLPSDVRMCSALHNDHGTSEQFHSELKSDMNVELLPSGRMATNSLVLGLATLAFNCLRAIGQAALSCEPPPQNEEKRLIRHRLRTVLLDYIKVGCKVVSHAGQTLLKFGRSCWNFLIIKRIYETA